VDRNEARAILRTHLESFRKRSYADLLGLMGDVQVAEVIGPSGVEYQIEIEILWDSLRDKTNICVLGTIDDGRLPGAILPVNDSFLMASDGSFVGE